MKNTYIATKQTKVILFPQKKALTYPNAMDRELKIQKCLDCALTIAAGAGITTSLLFLFTIL